MLNAEDSDLEQMLQEGIEAVKRRDYAQGRDLLLKVVEHNDQSEQAWLWLSLVVDDPGDQATALENVLTINPHNVEAQQRLALLSKNSQENEPPAPALQAEASDYWKHLLPETPLEEADDIDDPFQCIYCGQITAPEDRKCPRCKKKLTWRVQRLEGLSQFLKLAVLLMGLAAAVGALQMVGPLFALNVSRGDDPSFFQFLLSVFGVEPFLGNFLQLKPQVAQPLLVVYAGRLGLFLLLTLGLSRQWKVAYYGAIVTLAADLLLNAYLVINGYLGIAGSLINILFDLGIFGLLFSTYPEFAVNEERLLTKPDSAGHGALDFYQRGHFYRKYGMWAMAVAQWRKAVGLAPREVMYYKDLGIGYAQIRRFKRSLRVLEEAQRQAPNDPAIPEMIALVRQQAAKDSQGKR